jgi:hypothetical protein
MYRKARRCNFAHGKKTPGIFLKAMAVLARRQWLCLDYPISATANGGISRIIHLPIQMAQTSKQDRDYSAFIAFPLIVSANPRLAYRHELRPKEQHQAEL